jgi:hypothetical protein
MSECRHAICRESSSNDARLAHQRVARRPRVNPSHVYDRISGRELVRASTRNEIALAAGAGIRQRQEQNFVSLIGQSPGERNWRRPQEGKGAGCQPHEKSAASRLAWDCWGVRLVVGGTHVIRTVPRACQRLLALGRGDRIGRRSPAFHYNG